MRFLVVDADFHARTVMQRALKPHGWVDLAVDGEEAVAAFCLAHSEGEPYDLITMDVLLPHANGQDALREIRQIEREMNIPAEAAVKVIMVSDLMDPKTLHDAFFLGSAASYIVKPVRQQLFLEEIASLGLPVRTTDLRV